MGKDSNTASDDIILRVLVADRKPITVPLNITILEPDSHLKASSYLSYSAQLLAKNIVRKKVSKRLSIHDCVVFCRSTKIVH